MAMTSGSSGVCAKYANRILGANGQREPNVSWLILLGAYLIGVNVGFSDTIYSVLYDHVTTEYDVTRATAAWMVSAYIAGFTGIGLLTNPLISLHPAGARVVGVAGGLLLMLGASLASTAASVTAFHLTMGLLVGTGAGTATLVANVIIIRHFDHNRGLAMATLTLGYTTGTIVCPPVVSSLIDFYGLKGSLLIVGGIFGQTIILVLACTMQSTETEPTHPAQGNQDKLTCKTYGRQFCALSVFRNPRFVLFVMANMLAKVGRLGLLSFSVNKALYLGIEAHKAAYLPSVIGVTNLALRVPSMLVMNVKTVDEVLYHSLGIAALSVGAFVFGAASNYSMMVAAMVCLGSMEGISSTAFALVLVRMVGRSDFPKALSLTMMFAGFTIFLAMPFTGWMVDLFGDYQAAFYIIGAMSVAATILEVIIVCLGHVTAAKETRNKPSNAESVDVINKAESAGVLTNHESADVLTNAASADVLTDAESADVLSNDESADILTDAESADVLTNAEWTDVLTNAESADVLTKAEPAYIPSKAESIDGLKNTELVATAIVTGNGRVSSGDESLNMLNGSVKHESVKSWHLDNSCHVEA